MFKTKQVTRNQSINIISKMNNINLELLYSIHKEIQQNEMVEKVVWNDKITDQVQQKFINENQIQVIGLYGTFASIREYIQQRNQYTIQETEEIKRWKQRGMLCWVDCQNIQYISFIANETYFTKDLAEESSEIVLYRFLRDLCPNIIILPTQNIIKGWKNTDQPFYMSENVQPQQHEIVQTNDSQLTYQQITFIYQDYNDSSQFAPGQGNVRCHQLQETGNDQIILTDLEMDQMFKFLIQKPYQNIYQLKLDNFSNKIKQIIQYESNNFKIKIDKQLHQISSQFNNNIHTISCQGLYNNAQQDNQLLNLLHKILFPIFQDLLDLNQQKQFDRKIIQQKALESIENQDKQAFLLLSQNNKVLQNIITQYCELFQDLCTSGNSPLRTLQRQYKEQLKRQIQQMESQSDFFININLNEFRYINQQDNASQSECRIDFSKSLKISLTNVLQGQLNKNIKIQYFFYNENRKQIMIILYQKILQRNQYYWINFKEMKSKNITTFDQELTKPLIFYYDNQTNNMFVFNTKIGITQIEYNQDRECMINERNIQYNQNLVFQELCYLTYSQFFILLDKKNKLYKWATGDKIIQELKLDPDFRTNQNNSQNYQKVMSSGKGRYFILANKEKCDIYNFNNSCVEQIIFKNYGIQKQNLNQLSLYSNEQDWFICLMDNIKQTTIQIKNSSSSQTIISQTIRQARTKSNQLIDLIKGSSIKYGPMINLQKGSLLDNFHFIQKQYYDKIVNYFVNSEFDINEKLECCERIFEVQPVSIQANLFLFNIISRISIQLCTIEQSSLIPLCDGLRVKQDQFQINELRILDKVEQIQFGILERLLLKYNQNIYIISIIGKQSSGKSYLLNRIFGTRFGVSSARCTDGIWLGLSKIDDKIFVILDCEGLFSSRRTPDEETMLLELLSSVSDITILNQDLNFSRNLNELFEKLSLQIQQLRGEILFKGELLIAVRDVQQNTRNEAEQELNNNMISIIAKQSTGGFMKKLFNNNYVSYMMSYFDTKEFDKQINELRKTFLRKASITNRWKDQKQLLRLMKIMLVQIEVKDHRSLEEHELEYIIQAIKRRSEYLWFSYKQKGIENIQFDNIQDSYDKLIKFAQQICGNIKSSLNHDQRLKDWNNFIKTHMKKRKDEIFQQIKQESYQQNMAYDKDKLQNLEQQISQHLIDQSNLYQICLEKCGQCFLQCKKRKFHDQSNEQQQLEELQEQIQYLQQQIKVNTKMVKRLDKLDKLKEDLLIKRQNLRKLKNSLNFKKTKQAINIENMELEKLCRGGKIIPTVLDKYRQLIQKSSQETFLILQKYFPKQINQYQQQINFENRQIQQKTVNKVLVSDHFDDCDEIASEILDFNGLVQVNHTPHEFRSKMQQFNYEHKHLGISQTIEQLQPNKILKQLLNNIQTQEKILSNIDFYDEQLLIQNENKLMDKINQQNLEIEELNMLIDIIMLIEQKQKHIEVIKLSQIKQHDCGSDNHGCDQQCQGCDNKENFCKLLKGHFSQDSQNHLCNKQEHFCRQKCSFNDCQNLCQNIYQHASKLQHDCLAKHPCPKKCQFCNNKCEEDIKTSHQVHKCQIKQCQEKCFFSQNFFSEDKKCNQNCTHQHSENHKFHTCDKDVHQCYQKCQIPGICQISLYTESINTWITQSGAKFDYKCYKQNSEKKQCQILLQKSQISHQGQHQCVEKQHICDKRCPECESICTQPYGHIGKHNPHLHRNKNQQIFTALVGSDTRVVIQEDGEQEREYLLGESCEPETCTKSCARRSRAHFHLIECQGGDKCFEFKLNKNGKQVARHQSNQYYGSNKLYDEILCQNYWDLINWEHPVENQKLKNQIQQCNYYCSLCGESEKEFCIKEAWHTYSQKYADHSFSCKEQHKRIKGIDIQFIIDTTGSMNNDNNIKTAKQTVERLMDTARQYINNDAKQIQFSIVSYKDHTDKKLVESIDFGPYEKAVYFIKHLNAEGGGDYPEAMFDGLQKKY